MLTSKTSPAMTRNPNGWSKFREYRVYLPILRLFTYTRSRLVLRGWRQRQLPRTRDIVYRRNDTLQTSPAMTRIDRNSTITKIYAYEIKQDLSKNILLLLERRHYDANAHCCNFVSYCHLQRLMLSPTKNIFSTTLNPTEKLRYTYWRVFCKFYFYSKIIDIIRNNNVSSSIFKHV